MEKLLSRTDLERLKLGALKKIAASLELESERGSKSEFIEAIYQAQVPREKIFIL